MIYCRLAEENTLLSHDLTEIRRKALSNLSTAQGEFHKDVIDKAVEVFLEVRSDVVQHFYDDSIPCLQWLSKEQNVKVGVLTNGNARLMTAPTLDNILHISLTACQTGNS